MLKIYNKFVSNEFIQLTINKVKSKNELKNLDDKYIVEFMTKFLEQNTKLLEISKQINETNQTNKNNIKKINKNALFKEMIKYIRKESRLIYGMFQKPNDIIKREKLLNQLNIAITNGKKYNNIIENILNTHISTKERINIYEEFNKNLESTINKTEKEFDTLNFIDIACGLNPIAMIYFAKKYSNKKINYIAFELNKNDSDYLNKFFKIIQKLNPDFKGTAYPIDLRKDYSKIKSILKDENIFQYNNSINFIFLFKIIEILEKHKKHFSFNIFDQFKINEPKNNLKSNKTKFCFDYCIASFPTQTLANKKTTNIERLWFSKMLEKMNLKSKIINLKNEIFYVISE